MDDKRFIAPQTRPTLCWSCARACGGCSWTARDPKTHAIRFEPVKGWEAEKTTINSSKSEHGEKCYRYTTDSYRVVRCPLYVPDRRTRAKSAMPEWAMQARHYSMRRGRSAREMRVIQDAIAAIEGQQPKERSAVWMVGEQLKDMVRGNEAAAALLLTDLTQNKEMTLAAAEKKIAERAKKNKVGNCGCVTPAEAEVILREFFGLPERGTAAAPQTERRKVVDLADFL